MALVSLINAKAHLREPLDSHDHDLDIQQKAEHASVLVLGLCNSTAWWREITPLWTEANVPGDVQAAVLVLLTHLWEHRGDNMEPHDSIWRAVNSLLAMKKDPVIA